MENVKSAGQLLVAALVLLPISGCKNLSADCTSIGRFGLSVIVRDIRTGQAPAVGSTLFVRDGAYQEQFPAPGTPAGQSSDFGAANNRPGTYDLRVTTSGYSDWIRTGVKVDADACGHPKTVSLTAAISPS